MSVLTTSHMRVGWFVRGLVLAAVVVEVSASSGVGKPPLAEKRAARAVTVSAGHGDVNTDTGVKQVNNGRATSDQEADFSPNPAYYNYYYNGPYHCDGTYCGFYRSTCCGSNCCESGNDCCDEYGECSVCGTNYYYNGPYYCDGSYCGFYKSSCCGSNCCESGYECCNAYSECTDCNDDDTFYDDFKAINDDFPYDWYCGSTQCYYDYGSTKPNGCCGSMCCYGDDYYCDDYGMCATSPHGDDDVNIKNAVAVATGIIVGASIGGCALLAACVGLCVYVSMWIRSGSAPGFTKSAGATIITASASNPVYAPVGGVQLQPVSYMSTPSAPPIPVFASAPAQFGATPPGGMAYSAVPPPPMAVVATAVGGTRI
jgi:hypothetical protein